MDSEKIMDKDPGMPKIAKELLRKLEIRGITLEDFLKECAYWGMEFIDNYRFKEFPQKPKEILDYLEKKRNDFDYELSKDFWNQGFIKAYMNDWHTVFAENISNKHWLEEMQKHIPQEDTISQLKIKEALSTFKGTNRDWLKY